MVYTFSSLVYKLVYTSLLSDINNHPYTQEVLMSSPKFCITKRPNKIYYIRIIDDNVTTWKSTGCFKKPAAREFMQTFIDQYNSVDVVKPTLAPKMSEYKKTYLALNASTLRTKTLQTNAWNIDKFIKLAGDKRIDQYNSNDYELIRTKQIEESWCVVTANTFTRSIKAILNFAVTREIIPVHPLAKIKLLKQPKQAPLFLSTDDLKKVLDKVTVPMLRDIYQFAAFTGLRLGEILNLRKENVDLENKVIKVSNTETFTTKSGRERLVPISNSLIELIKRQPEGIYLFSKKEKYTFDGNYVSQQFRFAVRKTDVNQKIHFHSLRHTFCSLLVQNNVSIYHVQKLAGHSSVTTTEIYSHLAHNDLQNAVKCLPAF